MVTIGERYVCGDNRGRYVCGDNRGTVRLKTRGCEMPTVAVVCLIVSRRPAITRSRFLAIIPWFAAVAGLSGWGPS